MIASPELAKPKTCGDHGGVIKDGSPCTRKEFWGIQKGMPRGEVPGRCIHHREGLFLSPHEKRFVEAYTGSCYLNQKRSALVATNCKETSAHVIGHEMFHRPKVQRAIKERLDRVSMQEDEILLRYTELARGDISRFLRFDEDRGTFTIDLASEEARSFLFLVKKVKQVEEIIDSHDDEESFRIQRRTEIELHDVMRALDMLTKIRGMLIDKHEVTGKDGKPIELLDVGKARERLMRRVAGVASRIGTQGDPAGHSGNGGRGS